MHALLCSASYNEFLHNTETLKVHSLRSARSAFALGLCASKTCASAQISLTKIAETLQRRTLHSQRLARRNSFEWRSSAGVLSRFSRLAALQKVALARGVHIHRLGGAGGCDTVESGNRYMPAYLSCSYVASQKSASRRPSFFLALRKCWAAESFEWGSGGHTKRQPTPSRNLFTPRAGLWPSIHDGTAWEIAQHRTTRAMLH